MLSLQGEAEDAGAVMRLQHPLVAGATGGGRIELEAGGDAAGALECGSSSTPPASSPAVAAQHRGAAAAASAGLLRKGHLFHPRARAPFRHLIYPVPERDGLGVHLTLDMAGRRASGRTPNGWSASTTASTRPAAPASTAAIRRYWPELPDGALMPSYSGIRPKLFRPAGRRTDFLIEGPRVHGVAGLVNLFGIESPGLTSSLAIAEYVGKLAGL